MVRFHIASNKAVFTDERALSIFSQRKSKMKFGRYTGNSFIIIADDSDSIEMATLAYILFLFLLDGCHIYKCHNGFRMVSENG